MATDLANLKSIKSNLLQVLADETAYQVTNGPKPSYSLDGESMSWNEWRGAILDKIQLLNNLIQNEQTPFQVVSRARP